jgi:hypothetical protein
VVRIGLDEKKSDKLHQDLLYDLKRQNCIMEYEKVILAIDASDLEVWAREVAKEKAEVDLANRKKKKEAESG